MDRGAQQGLQESDMTKKLSPHMLIVFFLRYHFAIFLSILHFHQ